MAKDQIKVDPIFPSSSLEKESLEVEGERVMDDKNAELCLTDPVAFERFAMDSIGGPVEDMDDDDGET